jgi:hypothetical protein
MIPLKDGDLMLNLHSENQGRILSLKSSRHRIGYYIWSIVLKKHNISENWHRGHVGSSSDWVKLTTIKLVFVSSSLSTQH